jgi:hypothetical protein
LPIYSAAKCKKDHKNTAGEDAGPNPAAFVFIVPFVASSIVSGRRSFKEVL